MLWLHQPFFEPPVSEMHKGVDAHKDQTGHNEPGTWVWLRGPKVGVERPWPQKSALRHRSGSTPATLATLDNATVLNTTEMSDRPEGDCLGVSGGDLWCDLPSYRSPWQRQSGGEFCSDQTGDEDEGDPEGVIGADDPDAAKDSKHNPQ